jgi:hypothetical protein
MMVRTPFERGEEALETLEHLVHQQWSRLSDEERRRLGGNAEGVVVEIKTWVDNLSKPTLTIKRTTVAQRQASLQEQAIKHPGFVPNSLPHLEAKAESKAPSPESPRSLGVFEAGTRPENPITIDNSRPLDDRTAALRDGKSEFTEKQIEALWATVRKTQGDLRRLLETPIGKRVVVQWPTGTVPIRETLDGLTWYDRELFPRLLEILKTTGSRMQPMLSRSVVGLLMLAGRATGRDSATEIAHILNWRLPRKNGSWNAKLLRRWKRDYDRQQRALKVAPPLSFGEKLGVQGGFAAPPHGARHEWSQPLQPDAGGIMDADGIVHRPVDRAQRNERKLPPWRFSKAQSDPNEPVKAVEIAETADPQSDERSE